MMKFLSAIVEASLRNRLIVLVLAALLVGFGLYSAKTLPIDAVPDVTNVQVQIITAAPALSAVEVEQYITVPVERAMSGVPQVTQVRSISKYGLSVVTVVFTDETNLYLARQLIAERMREAEDTVPRQYGKPEMAPISSGLGEIFQFVVRGEGRSLMEVEETLDWYLGPQLRTVPGVVEVNSFGGENREYQVVLNPTRLRSLGISIREVVEAIERTNANAGGGYIEHNREQYVIGASGLVRNREDLGLVVIGATPQGIPITLGQLGEVQFGPRLRRGAASRDGKGEVAVGVAMMLLGGNSRTVTEGIKAKLVELEKSLPSGISVEPFYDRSVLVDRTIHTVAKNLVEGAGLVLLVLFLLLGSLRAGLVVAATIPLAMLFALLFMKIRGDSGNLMSLGAIDFGLIVDGAVIIVENAVRHLNEARARKGMDLTPQERLSIVRDSTLEVRSATIFGEAIIAIVYLPILTLSGIEGKLFRPMAVTVLLALLGAFFFSLTVIPILCSLLLRPSKHHREPFLVRKLEALYKPILHKTLTKRWLTLSLGVLLMTVGVGLFTRLGAEFVPQLDEGDLLVEARRLPGISLSESVATDHRLQQAILQVPEVRQVVSRTGAPELATDPMGIEQSDVYILLKPQTAWRSGITKAQIAEEISKKVSLQVPEVSTAISQPIQMRTNELIAGVRSDVAVLIYGPDLKELKNLGDQVAAVLSKIPGAVDVRTEQNAGLNYIRIRPDRAKLARYGLTIQDINQLTQTLAVGHPAGTVFEGDRRFDIVVKVLAPFQGSVDDFRGLPLKATTGQMIPLGDVAEIQIEQGPVVINREQQSRRLIVEFNVRGRDLLSVVNDAKTAVQKQVTRPSGYWIDWGGQFQHFVEAKSRLMLVVPLALALIFFLLWMAFHALRPAILIFCNIPFAIIGGVIALWLRQIPFSISAGVGFVALFGVAVLNGLVLVTFSRRLEADGLSPAEAIEQAAQLRLRPVIMTALVASLGFIPMALSRAPGSEVQRPLATVVIGGLITATLLTLFLFPTLYRLVHRKKKTLPPIEVSVESTSETQPHPPSEKTHES